MQRIHNDKKKIPQGLRSIEDKILDKILEESDDYFEEDEWV